MTTDPILPPAAEEVEMYMIHHFYSFTDLGNVYIGILCGCVVGYMIFTFILRFLEVD